MAADAAAPAVGGRGINPGAWVVKASAEEAEAIPEDWGWPSEPHDADALRKYIMSLEGDQLQPNDSSIDPHCFEMGRWYIFAKADGSGHLYVHNYTRDTTATPPPNFDNLSEKDQRKLGSSINVLPEVLRKIHSRKVIPIVHGSSAACHALKQYAIYGHGQQLLDTTKLRRLNPVVLEESRQAIVGAMKFGKTLCVYLGDHICDFKEKVCIGKNRDKFPVQLFSPGGLLAENVKEKMYREDDLEGGQRIVRDGFEVYLLVPYDREDDLAMSTTFMDELAANVPEFSLMKEVRCSIEDDRTRLVQVSQRRSQAS